ncbi:MAG: HD domain-containing protein [Elusimicrobiaceae bacterium]|nr:HD domain-containing protein [Elusimicrobiaceae bacterium]
MIKNPFSDEIYLKRTHPHTPDLRDEYFRDQTKIIHSLPFRRLKHKAQVFFAPKNDHICTRIEHVLHVATIAATICRGLNKSGNWQLSEDLAYAVGLGHDIGHAPFGHEGERAIDACLKPSGKRFLHELNSYRVVEHIANYGEGLNLTFAVKDGIICHCGEDFQNNALRPGKTPNDLESITGRRQMPSTYEGCIVRLADKIAYFGRDIEDAIKADLITKEDIPAIVRKEVGSSNGEIINTLTLDLIDHSKDKDFIGFSDEKFHLISQLRDFNYQRIYCNEDMLRRKEIVAKSLRDLFDFFQNQFARHGFDYAAYLCEPQQAARGFGNYLKSMKNFYQENAQEIDTAIADYIAGMTDSFALSTMQEVLLPTALDFSK